MEPVALTSDQTTPDLPPPTAARWRALAQIAACSGVPTQLLIAQLLALVGVGPFGEGGALNATWVFVVSLVDTVVRDRGWNGRVRVEGTGARVASDPRRIERVVTNLVDNALEHGGGEATVLVGAGTVEVADDGPGIPADQLPHVFERFWKGDPARSGPGSGLGLAIARENARLLGGDVEVASEPGRGTRFTFRLP